jgi:predicted acylesterase/phospholipase RssA
MNGEGKLVVAEMAALRNNGNYAGARARGERALHELSPTGEAREQLDVALALATYKDPDLRVRWALETALGLVRPYRDSSHDPETLGVAGAIEKRLYELSVRLDHLENALFYYTRGHELDRASGWPKQGYPGINAAHLLDVLASIEAVSPLPETLIRADQRRLAARRLREELKTVPVPLEEADRYFHTVTLAEVHLGLGDFDQARDHFARARRLNPWGWQLETTARQVAGGMRLRHGGKVPAEGRTALGALLEGRTDAVCGAIRGKLGLALSGGGFRASFYHLGVLARMAELDLLRHVEVLSCVSGGSLVGALYYLELKALLEAKEDHEIAGSDYVALVDRVARRFLAGVGLDIRNRVALDFTANMAMFSGDSSRSERIAELYEDLLYTITGPLDDQQRHRDPRYMDQLTIQPRGTEGFRPTHDNWGRSNKVPIIVLNAATLNTGHLWEFSADRMGEPPVRVDEDIDVNDRFDRQPYDRFPKPNHRIRLGTAVAASACVPGLFDPIEIRSAYDQHVVRLVDGGVHDNQGVAALLERDCTSLIVSDASGQMAMESAPAGSALMVALRANSVLQARVREAQHADLRSRERGRLVRTFAFLHLKRGMTPATIRPRAETDGNAPTREPLPYPVSWEVQERLAAIRTDLDAFSQLEAEMLMTSGYHMATSYVDPAAFEAPARNEDQALKHFWFLRVHALMRARPTGTLAEQRVLELLRAGESILGKAFLVNRPAKHIATVFGLAAVGVIGCLVYKYRSSPVTNLTVGALGLALGVAIVGWRVPELRPSLDAFAPAKKLTRILWTAGLSALGAIAAFIAIHVGDRIFLTAGRVEPLLERQRQQDKSRGPTEASPS